MGQDMTVVRACGAILLVVACLARADDAQDVADLRVLISNSDRYEWLRANTYYTDVSRLMHHPQAAGTGFHDADLDAAIDKEIEREAWRRLQNLGEDCDGCP